MRNASAVKMLGLPPSYNAAQAGDPSFQADVAALQIEAEKWRERHSLKPVGGDKKRVYLLVIDDQYDFSFPSGALYVGGRSGTGAMDAQKLLCEFIYHYLHVITQITPTMDTHLPFQVFYPSVHLRADGTHPSAYTMISADEYRRGDYRPNPAMAVQIGADPAWLQKQFIFYCEQLEKNGKYKLYLWPYHCMLGSPGHRLSGVVEAARLFHSFARGAANIPEIKGGNPLTEHYSIFAPEVTTTWDGKPIPGVQKNTKLIETLLKSDVVIIAGEASSHCVKESIADFLKEILAKDPELAKKIYIMRDCMAAVVVPNVVDYTDEAEKALQEFQDAGMHVVESTTPIEDWPRIPNLVA